MKKISMMASLAFLFMLFTFNTYCQNIPDQRHQERNRDQIQRSERHFDRMSNEMNLSDEQKTRMKEMRREKMGKHEDMKRDRMAYRVEERKNDDRRIRSILNEKQYRTFEKKKSMKENSREMKGKHKRDHHGLKQGKKHHGERKMWRNKHHGPKG